MINPRVKVCQGELEGLTSTTIAGTQYCSFRGIPYAEPPVGPLRFKSPVPIKNWDGVKNATKDGVECAQVQMLTSEFTGEEDCLHLNVYTPHLPAHKKSDKPLPVMVYIHGGGFVNGCNNSANFGPDFLVEQETVIVSINYRLGVLGFLCLDIPSVPGNAGLKDQVLALQWVQENIAAFNGDPTNVTIFGISAGSASVEYHLISPASKGLYHQAIMQSGSTLNPWARSRNSPALAVQLGRALGLEFDLPIDILIELQKVDLENLILVSSQIKNQENMLAGEIFSFCPVVERSFRNVKSFLAKEPIDVLKSGEYHQVPTITGYCENEGGIFKNFYGSLIEALNKNNFIDFIPKYIKVDRVELDKTLRELYGRRENETEDSTRGIDDFLSDLLFFAGIDTSIALRHKNTSPNFVYQFTHTGSIDLVKEIFKIEDKCSYHGDDTGYLAPSVFIKEEKATEKDKIVRKRMVKMWTDFAKTGNPTPATNSLIPTEWLPYSEMNKCLLSIDYDVAMKPMPYPKRFKFWEAIYSTV